MIAPHSFQRVAVWDILQIMGLALLDLEWVLRGTRELCRRFMG